MRIIRDVKPIASCLLCKDRVYKRFCQIFMWKISELVENFCINTTNMQILMHKLTQNKGRHAEKSKHHK